MGTIGFGISQQLLNQQKQRKSVEDIISGPIGSITSRDQIINPDELVDPANYSNTRRGQAQYTADLEAARYFASQQEAAFKEWYESPEQVAARQREAGINPDLVGLQESQAATVDQREANGMLGQPTNGQIFVDTVSSIGSVLSSVSGIMGIVSQIGINSATKDLIEQQSDGQLLNNIGSFIDLSSAAVSDKLAKAIKSSENFNIDDFYSGDFSDVLSLAPSDDPRYQSAFRHVLNDSQKTYSDAYKQLATSEEGRKQFLSQLASGYYSDDDDVMIGQLSIMVKADEELHRMYTSAQTEINDAIDSYVSSLDPDVAASSVNSVNQYNDDYYSELDGKLVAILQKYIQEGQAYQSKATGDVYNYLNRRYNSARSLFDKRYKSNIGWQITAGAHMGWQDHYAATSKKYVSLLIDHMLSKLRILNSQGLLTEQQANYYGIKVGTDVINAGANFISAFIPF